MNLKQAAAILFPLFIIVAPIDGIAHGAKIPTGLLERFEQPARDVWLPAAQEIAAFGRDGARLLRERRTKLPDARIGARYDSLISDIARLHADLLVEPRTLRVGGEISYEVVLRNETDGKLLVALPADGSEDGRRSPRIGLEITDADENSTHADARWVRAGEIAPLREGDFRWLDAGEKLALFGAPHAGRINGEWFWRAPRPGLYRVRFVYDALTTEWAAWSGSRRDPSKAMKQLFDSVHHARVVSDWVTIHVIE